MKENSKPTISNIIMMQCASCEKPYGTTDISQVFCYNCQKAINRSSKFHENHGHGIVEFEEDEE